MRDRETIFDYGSHVKSKETQAWIRFRPLQRSCHGWTQVRYICLPFLHAFISWSTKVSSSTPFLLFKWLIASREIRHYHSINLRTSLKTFGRTVNHFPCFLGFASHFHLCQTIATQPAIISHVFPYAHRNMHHFLAYFTCPIRCKPQPRHHFVLIKTSATSQAMGRDVLRYA